MTTDSPASPAAEPLAVFRRRQPGALRRVALQDGAPPLWVEFEVPDGVKLAAIDAAASHALSVLVSQPSVMARYGLEARAPSRDDILAFTRSLILIEAAIQLWRDWNYALEVDPGEPPVKGVLKPEVIARLLIDNADARSAWSMHLDGASPLERAEGNVYGASPSMSSDEAPPTATDAGSSESPAPADFPRPTESSAPE